jgi:lipopolysaccharide heptosyltransferase II
MIEPKNLLIVRTDRIGDVVLSLPLAEIVKKHFPSCKISFLLREYTKALINKHPFVDDVLLLKEQDGKVLIRENSLELRKYHFDSCLIVYPTFQTALISFLSGIKHRVGTGYRWYSFLLNHKIFEHRKYAERHELEYNVNLLKAFGISENVSRDSINFHLTAASENEIRINKILDDHGVNQLNKIVIIHPGSGGSAVDLPIKNFQDLIEKLSADANITIIVTGLSSEKELCEQLVTNSKIKNFSGLLDLGDMIALIKKASLFISNSTGPLHIAAALGKNTIGFYPKILSCSPKRWGPYSNKSKIFTPEIGCSNCTREQCERLNCMNSIDMAKVFSEAQNLLNFKQINGEFNA